MESLDLRLCQAFIGNGDNSEYHGDCTYPTADDRVDVQLVPSPRRSYSLGRLFNSDRNLQQISKPGQASSTQEFLPCLHIVLQVVGTLDDVQPFITLGRALAEFGHRVRITTNSMFENLIQENGLEFFNIGESEEPFPVAERDPRPVLPRQANPWERYYGGDVNNLNKILDGCWRSCFQSADRSRDLTGASSKSPFLANAIIANPMSFAHVHCAQKLGIPLHLMDSCPSFPTTAFPHPMTNVHSSSFDIGFTNYLSYGVIEHFIWEDIGNEINSFRQLTLGLPPLNRWMGPNLTTQLRIPYIHCWSSALLPKPEDWDSSISVSGFMIPPANSTDTCSEDLEAFLNSGSPPVFIDFDSLNAENLQPQISLFSDASCLAGVRIIISHSQREIQCNQPQLPPSVFLVYQCPISKVIEKVCCVVCSGGIGTTAAVLTAGKPLVILPVFGDQFFWGNIVAEAGVGPPPVRLQDITAEKLATSLRKAIEPETILKATTLSRRMKHEEGALMAVSSFHDQLLKSKLSCSIAPTHAATWKVSRTDVRLSACAAAVLMGTGLLDFEKVELLQPCSYMITTGPGDPIIGVAFALKDTVSGFSKGMEKSAHSIKHSLQRKHDYLSSNARGESRGNSRMLDTISGSVKGLEEASIALLRAPVYIGLALTQGLHNAPNIWGDPHIRPPPIMDGVFTGFQAGGREFTLGIYDGFIALVSLLKSGIQSRSARSFFSSIGTATLSFVFKNLSGLTALVFYPLKGVDAGVVKRFSTKSPSKYEKALLQKGVIEAAQLGDSDYKRILDGWELATAHVRRSKLKSRRSWSLGLLAKR